MTKRCTFIRTNGQQCKQKTQEHGLCWRHCDKKNCPKKSSKKSSSKKDLKPTYKREKNAVIFTTPECDLCFRTKNLLLSKGWNVEEKIILKHRYGKDENNLQHRTGMKYTEYTVPQVFLNDVWIGSYNHVKMIADFK